MTKASFIKQDGLLRAADKDAQEMLATIRDGREVMVRVHTPRWPRHHRLFFALLNAVVEGGAWDGDTESLLDYVKLGVGHVKTVIGPDGKTHFIPKSIAFESMSQDKFNRFFDRACWLICERLLGGADWQSLRNEIIEAVDGPMSREKAA